MIDIDHLKSARPLSALIGQVVNLRRSGREFVGLCPFHEESTPSFYVNDQKAVYFCHGCGATGDCIDFVMAHQGMTFSDALRHLESESPIGNGTPPRPSKLSKAADHSGWAREIWAAARPIAGTIGEKYLVGRGLDANLVRSVPSLRFSWLKCKGIAGEHPTLVAAFTDLRGDVTSIQRIFLTRDARKISTDHPHIDAKQCLGSSAGGAVKFGTDLGRIVLAESIEDGLSLFQHAPHETVWAVAGASRIPKVELPPACSTVVIAPDNDPAGQKAIANARLTFMNQGKEVVDLIPSTPFRDWNEQHLAEISA
jgi:DNA primase